MLTMDAPSVSQHRRRAVVCACGRFRTGSRGVARARAGSPGGKLGGEVPPPPPVREEPYSPAELLAEISRIVTDVARFFAEQAERGWAAFFAAQVAASIRDETRPRPREAVGLGHLGSLFTAWLLERPDRETFEQNLAAAQRALAGAQDEQRLASDLHEFVTGHLDGSILPDEFVRRLKKARPKPPRRPPAPRSRGPNAISLTVAESTLKSMLAEIGDQKLCGQPTAVWEVFKRFLAPPIVAEPPERIERSSDDFLFEWGIYPSAADVLSVSFGRVFTILDEDDDYDRREQLTCELVFPISPDLHALGTHALWSEQGLDAWICGGCRTPDRTVGACGGRSAVRRIGSRTGRLAASANLHR